MTDLSVEDYSERAIVVRGDTKPYKEQLKQLGGKYNPNLRDGPGWIFSKKSEDRVLAFVATGKPAENEDSDEPENKKNDTFTDLLKQIETRTKTATSQQKLALLSNIALILAKDTKTEKSVISQKPTSKIVTKTMADLTVSSDDDEEDYQIPHKRMLS